MVMVTMTTWSSRMKKSTTRLQTKMCHFMFLFFIFAIFIAVVIIIITTKLFQVSACLKITPITTTTVHSKISMHTFIILVIVILVGVLCYGGRSDGCGGSSGSMVIVVIFIS